MKKTYFYYLILYHFSFIFNKTINLNNYYQQEQSFSYSTKDINESKIEISYFTQNTNQEIDAIITSLSHMPEIKFIDCKAATIKDAILISEKKKVSLCLTLESHENIIIWKLYNTIEKKFITGKKYIIKSANIEKIVCTVLYDLWKELFDEDINPFNMYIIYLNNKEYTNENNIMLTQPFIKNYTLCLLSTEYPILDMGIIPSYPHNAIMFTQQKQIYMYLKKINSHGQIISLYKTKHTISSPTANIDGLFFIENEKLKYYYFNPIVNQYKIITLDNNKDYASIYSIPKEHTLLASRNNKIYKINYYIDDMSKQIHIKNGKKITEKNILSTNMTYASHTKHIITSQKINHYYQLVMYDGPHKIILTNSPTHKQDPVISPCQNYISYVAQDNQGKRYIEIIHILTKQIKRITDKPGQYRFANWIVK